jgi:hypothetical protein
MRALSGWLNIAFAIRRALSRELGPECRCVFGLAPLQLELFLGVVPFPSTAAGELADIGEPALRQGMPFLSDIVEANPALHSRH